MRLAQLFAILLVSFVATAPCVAGVTPQIYPIAPIHFDGSSDGIKDFEKRYLKDVESEIKGKSDFGLVITITPADIDQQETQRRVDVVAKAIIDDGVPVSQIYVQIKNVEHERAMQQSMADFIRWQGRHELGQPDLKPYPVRLAAIVIVEVLPFAQSRRDTTIIPYESH
jgi:hypothetical protein